MNAYREQYAQLFNGGKDVVLLAISTDSPESQYEWARDAKYPWRFLSDSGGVVGRNYGGYRGRAVVVVDPAGKVTYVVPSFREVDPVAYADLGDAIQAAMKKKSP